MNNKDTEAPERLKAIQERYTGTATPRNTYEVRADDLAWLINEVELRSSRVDPPAAPDEADKALAHKILKHIGDSALETAFVRHSLTSDEFDADDFPSIKDEVEAHEKWWSEIKEDTLNCMTGDDTGCLDPEELDESNCELIWLTAALAQARKQQRETDAQIVSDARFEGGVDLRELVSRIKVNQK